MKHLKNFALNEGKTDKEYFVAKKNGTDESWDDDVRTGEFFIKSRSGYTKLLDGTDFPDTILSILKSYDASWIKDVTYSTYIGEGKNSGSIKDMSKALSKFGLFCYEMSDYDPWIFIITNKKLDRIQVDFINSL